MTKGVKFGIGGAVVIAVAALAVISAKKNSTKPVEVRTEAVEARDLVASVTASGQIQPRTKVDVSADVTGKIVRLSVKEGDVVKKGQFLLQIDPEQVTELLLGPLFHRWLLRTGPFTEAWVRTHVELVLRAAG